MATWKQFEHEAPEFAAQVRARFEATKHHVLATLRRDGSPRVSGTEVEFAGDDLTLGSMPGAVKARDLQRDPRFALHANPGDGSMDAGDAKLAGRAVEVGAEAAGQPDDPAGPPESPPSHRFRLDLAEAVLTTVENNEYLLIRTWRPGEDVKSVRRT
ncbi:MAG TPA: pyridoxamine 5'-phosphate oxidase family protein [Actinocrinis sp.]|jgi:hypothetical protein